MKQVLTLLGFVTSLVFVSSAASACSVHDQFCQFQGIGRAVNQTINQNDPTAVIIGTVGNNAVDFDNHVLLEDGSGPYIASWNGITPRTDQPYLGSDEQPRHVYPGQYQIDFQNGSAQAVYSGDVTGGAVIPGAAGCTISSATYCEEVRITGNIPDDGSPEGFVVRQTNHLYNFPNVPNPEIDVVSYGVATGRAYFKQDSHLGYSFDEVIVDGQAVRFNGIRQETLSGTGAQGAEQTYYIGYNDFDAHAAGVVVHYDQTRTVRSREYAVQFGHQVTLADGTTLHEFDGRQRQDTNIRFNRTYDFTKYIAADTGLPELHLSDNRTAQWDTWTDVYSATSNAMFENHQREQEELKSRAEDPLSSFQPSQNVFSLDVVGSLSNDPSSTFLSEVGIVPSYSGPLKGPTFLPDFTMSEPFIVSQDRVREVVRDAAEYHDVPQEILASILQQENRPDASSFQKFGQVFERTGTTVLSVYENGILDRFNLNIPFADTTAGIGNMSYPTLQGTLDYYSNELDRPVIPLEQGAINSGFQGVNYRADIYYSAGHIRELIDRRFDETDYSGPISNLEATQIMGAYNCGGFSCGYGTEALGNILEAELGNRPLYFYNED